MRSLTRLPRCPLFLIAAIAVWMSSALCDARGFAGDDPHVQIVNVEVGFDGVHKVGIWTPIAVTLKSRRDASVRLLIDAADPTGSVVTIRTPEMTSSARQSAVLRGFFKSGRLDGRVKVRIVSQGQTVASAVLDIRPWNDGKTETTLKTHPLKQSTVLLGTLGEPRDETGRSFDRFHGDLSTRPWRVVEFSEADQLPTNSRALDALDALVIAGSYNLDEARNEAVRAWVSGGGHLVLSVGTDVDSYSESRLSKWIPVRLDGRRSLRDLSGLETLSEKNARISFLGSVNSAKIERPDSGAVLAETLAGPLAVRVPYGFGRVTFLAVDLNRPPLTTWSGMPNLTKRLIDIDAGNRDKSTSTNRARLSHSGITDLATQLDAARNEVSDIQRPSPWSVMGLFFAYLLAAGPIDYLLVHRLFKRPQLTWLTFPIVIAIASGGAVWSAASTNGTRLVSTQVDIVDYDVELGSMRGISWAMIYSPETRRHEVAIQPQSIHADPTSDNTASTSTSNPAAHIIWSGVPETGYGGMYRNGGFEFGRPTYDVASDAGTIEKLPIPIWSTRRLEATWQATDVVAAESHLSITSNNVLTGHFRHFLDGSLQDWILVHGNRAYGPLLGSGGRIHRDLPAFTDWQPDGTNAYSKDLMSLLTGQTIINTNEDDPTKDEVLIRQTPYDPSGRNVASIVRMMTFHEAAGGKLYTGLSNKSLGRLEFSNLLNMERAVLFGRLTTRASELQIDGTPSPSARHETYVRIVLPVKNEHTDRRDTKLFKPAP